MKKINVLVLGCAVAVTAASCIKGDDFDAAAQYELEKPIIEAYAKEHLDNASLDEETGIWFEVVAPGDPESYQYKLIEDDINPSQSTIEAPVIYANYTGKLVNDNTIFDSNEEDEGAEFSLGSVIQAWILAFLPEEILYNQDGEYLEEPIKFGQVGGLTSGGLTAGSVIRIVTPSHLAYGHQGQGKVPADAPLYFEISVLSVEAPDTDGSN